MHANRRRHERHDAKFLVQHSSTVGAVPELDYARDISEGGIFVATARKRSVGDTVQVQFSPDRGGQLVVAFCRVARVTPEGFGAAFISRA
jgi:hypothetical protein